MSDPVSIAGTAVGITGLGIQACQIIYQYYSRYQSHHEDIKGVLQQIQGLEGMLMGLESVKSRIETDDHEPSSQLHMALERCRSGAEHLMQFAMKCGATQTHPDVYDRLRKEAKRLFWPLKRETFIDLRTNLTNLQHSLALAFNVLGIDNVTRNLDDLMSKLDNVYHQSTRVEHQVTSFSADMQLMGKNLQELSISQNRSLVRLKENMPAKVSTDTYQSSAEQQLALIRSIVNGDSSSTKSSPFGTTEHTNMSLRPRMSRKPCLCRKRKKRSVKEYGMVNYQVEENYEHGQDCSRYAHGDYSRVNATHFRIYTRIVKCCVIVGWQQSRTAGWLSLAPIIRYRTMVPWDAPPFEIFQRRSVTFGQSFGSKDDINVLKSVLVDLRHFFRQGWDPVVVNPAGKGIFSYLLSFVLLCRDPENPSWIKCVCESLDELIDEGVPLEDCNFVWIVSHTSPFYRRYADSGAGVQNIVSHWLRKRDHWSIPEGYWAQKQQTWDMISDLLEIEQVKNTLDIDCQLLRFILQRSVPDFYSDIQTKNLKDFMEFFKREQYAFPLLSWPNGLEILLDNRTQEECDVLSRQLWRYACTIGNPRSLKILLSQITEITHDSWEEILGTYSKHHDYGFPGDKDWKELFQLAISRLPHEPPQNAFVIATCEMDEQRHLNWGNLYHTSDLDVLVADTLWAAGDRNIDTVRQFRPVSDKEFDFGTALWNHAAIRCCKLDLVSWFKAKGASLSWQHPIFLTTPAHLISRHLMRETYYQSWINFKSLADVLGMQHRDGCSCYCSEGGCSVPGCAFTQSGGTNSLRHLMQDIKRQILPLVDQNPQAYSMGSAILRVLTFESLSLTHTCCYRVLEVYPNRSFTRPTPEEAEIIHDIEREDVAILDDLMDHFNESWRDYPDTFGNFLDKIWKPRMKEERMKNYGRRTNDEVYEATGVILKEEEEKVRKQRKSWMLFRTTVCSALLADSESDTD